MADCTAPPEPSPDEDVRNLIAELRYAACARGAGKTARARAVAELAEFCRMFAVAAAGNQARLVAIGKLLADNQGPGNA